MSNIVTMDEFAYAIGLPAGEAAEHVVLRELAEGLVRDEIGEQDPWPTVAKTVVLAAVARAFANPSGASTDQLSKGTRSWANARALVYLTDEDKADLHEPPGGAAGGAPTFSFPGTWPYPDPVERPTDYVTG